MDGVYNSVEMAVERIARTRLSRERLELLRQALQAQQDSSVTNHDAVARSIERSAPELGDLRDTIPKTRAELYAFIALLLTALPMLVAWIFGDEKASTGVQITNEVHVGVDVQRPELSAEDIARIVEEAAKQSLKVDPPQAEQRPQAAARSVKSGAARKKAKAARQARRKNRR